MLSWDYGFPMLLIIGMIVFAWFSFLSVAFFG